MEAGSSAPGTPEQRVTAITKRLYPRQSVVTLSTFVSSRVALPPWAKVCLLAVGQVASNPDLAAYPKFEEEGLGCVEAGRGHKLWSVAGYTLSGAAEKKLRLLAFGRAHERTIMLSAQEGGVGLPEYCLRDDRLLLPVGLSYTAVGFEHVAGAVEGFLALIAELGIEADLGLIRAALDVRGLSSLPAEKPEGWRSEVDSFAAACAAVAPGVSLLELQQTARSPMVLAAIRSTLSLVFQHSTFSQALETVSTLEPEAAARVLQGIPSVRLPFIAPGGNKYASSERGGSVVTVPLSSLSDTDPVFLADSRPAAQAIRSLPRDPRVHTGELYRNAGSVKKSGTKWVRATIPSVPAKVLKDLVSLMAKGDTGGSRDKKRGRGDSGESTGDDAGWQEHQEEGQVGEVVGDFNT